jgi:hypothetical protein
MMENGQEDLNMGMEYSCGPMELNMRECGPKVKLLVRENLPI